MQNSVVFPGGAVDKCDELPEWIDLYQKMGISKDKFKELKVSGPRPTIFQKPNENVLDREISLRITAVRETFEEMGVLICKSKEQFLKENQLFSNNFEQLDIAKWQSLVHNDPSKFIELCREYKIAPDLWNLFEWSSWLTPANFDRRFEVAFFIVALDKEPIIYPEEHEVAVYHVDDPPSLLSKHQSMKIFLPPPQLYELSRLTHKPDIVDVMKFAKQRNAIGQTLMWPVVFQSKDAFVQILPGDDAYPKNPNYVDQEEFELYSSKTADEIRAGIKNLHRFEYNSLKKFKFHMNIEPLDGHLKPVVSIPEHKL